MEPRLYMSYTSQSVRAMVIPTEASKTVPRRKKS